jgi:hypothetical protein
VRFLALIAVIIVGSIAALVAVIITLTVVTGGDSSSVETSAEPESTRPPNTAVVPPAMPLSLDKYLVRVLELDQEMNRTVVGLDQGLGGATPGSSEALATGAELFDEMGRAMGEFVGALSNMSPPPEARIYHRDLLTSLRAQKESIGVWADSFRANDPDRITRAARDFALASADANRLASDAARLSAIALERQPRDPLNDYLIDAARLRATYVIDFSGFFDPAMTEESAIAFLEQFVADLETFTRRWAQLTPTPQALLAHETQLGIAEAQLESGRSLLDAARASDNEAAAAASASTRGIHDQVSLFLIEWNDLIILAISR